MIGMMTAKPNPASRVGDLVCGSTAVEMAVVAASLAYFMLGLTLDRSAISFVVITGNLLMAGGLGYGAYRCATASPAGIWVSLFWLRAGSIAYLCVGTIIPFIVNDVTRMVIDAFHATTNEQYLRVSIVTALGSLCALSAATVVTRSLRFEKIGRLVIPSRDPVLLGVGLAAFSIGFVCRYIIALPSTLGLVDTIVPAMIINLSHFYQASFFLLGVWCFRYRPSHVWLIFVVAGLDAVVGLMMFSKLEVLFSLLMASLALMHSRATTIRLAVVVGVCMLTYVAIIPIVDFGRTVMLQRYGEIEGGGLAERKEIVQSYFGAEGEVFASSEFRSEFQGALARLSYSNQAAFAISLYDSKIPGDSVSQIPVAIVPRMLWPDKPNLNYIGEAFQESATGFTTSLSWPGQFAEAYWNYGWLGIILFSIPLGIAHALLSRYALWVYSAGQWIQFPALLLLMRWAMDLMTPIATNAVAGLVTVIFIAIFLRFVDAVLAPRRVSTPRTQWV